jgi:hypothetical protein
MCLLLGFIVFFNEKSIKIIVFFSFFTITLKSLKYIKKIINKQTLCTCGSE